MTTHIRPAQDANPILPRSDFPITAAAESTSAPVPQGRDPIPSAGAAPSEAPTEGPDRPKRKRSTVEKILNPLDFGGVVGPLSRTITTIGRGAVNAVDATAKSLIELVVEGQQKDFQRSQEFLSKIPGAPKTPEEREAFLDEGLPSATAKRLTAPIEATRDALFGPLEDAGLQGFVQDVAQFATGFTATRVIKPLQVVSKALQASKAGAGAVVAGRVAEGAVKGAVVDFAAFDPMRDQLAELAASTDIPGISVLGEMLSVEDTDGALDSRLKRAAGGVIPGVALDLLAFSARAVWGAGVARRATATAAEKAAGEKAVVEALAGIDEIAAGRHVPDEPIIVRRSDDGQFYELVEKDAPAIEKSTPAIDAPEAPAAPRPAADAPPVAADPNVLDLEKSTPAIEPPEGAFRTRHEAEGAAASANEVLRNQQIAKEVTLNDQQVKELTDFADQLKAAEGDPDKILDAFGKIRFNFSYRDTPEKTRALMLAISEKLNPIFEEAQRRPTVTFEQTADEVRQLAGQLTADEAGSYVSTALGFIKNADVALNMANVQLRHAFDDVDKWRTIVDARPNDTIALQELRLSMQAAARVTAEIAGGGSGVGRGLNALKVDGTGLLDDIKFAAGDAEAQAARAKGARTNGDAVRDAAAPKGLDADRINDLSDDELQALARLMAQGRGNNKVLFDTVAKALDRPDGLTGRIAGATTEFFYQSLLSNPALHGSIFVTNGAVSLMEDSIRTLAGFGRFIATGDDELIQSGADMLAGRMIYGKQSLEGFFSAYKAGRSIIDPKPIYEGIPNIQIGPTVAGVTPTLSGVVRTLASRPMSAVDEFWKVNNNLAFTRMESLRLNRRSARAQGLTGKAFDDFVQKRVADDVKISIDSETGASRSTLARKFAELPTFSGRLDSNSFPAKLEKLVRDNPIMVPLLPFVRTTVNLADYSFLKSSPLGVLTKEFRDAMATNGEEAAILGARMSVGSLLWGTAFLNALYNKENVTGSAPKQQGAKAAFFDDGRQENSIKIGNKWVSYRRFEPYATMMSMTVDVANAFRENSDDTVITEGTNNFFLALIAATVGNMGNKQYLGGFVAFSKAIGDGTESSMLNLSNRFVGAAVPGVLSAFNDDPYLRQLTEMHSILMDKVPGVSDKLPLRYNFMGEPIMPSVSRRQRSLNPFPISTEKESIGQDLLKISKEFVPPPVTERSGKEVVNFQDPKYKSTNKQSTLTPYDRLMELVKQADLRGQLTTLIASKQFQEAGTGTSTLPGGRRGALVSKKIARVYRDAERKMLREYPDLKAELTALRSSARKSRQSDARGEAPLSRLLQQREAQQDPSTFGDVTAGPPGLENITQDRPRPIGPQ